ncbi:MAG: hypothetical protein LQ337_003548 [Flavoplaca oasis]|nr:MAG: hypothetical protein LQ337_003548 [Flavoplaca oasis]
MPHRQDTVAVGFEDRFGGITHAFFEALSPNEKELFKATTIAELLLEEVKAAEKIHKDKSISRKVSQALKPLVQGVEQYGAALDVISNASSQFLCPVWGSMRVILHLASEFGEYFGKISAMLEQVGLYLNSLRRFPRLYPHNERLEAAMVDVYRIIFRFCTDARNVFKKVSEKKVCQKGMIGIRSMIKLVWKPFKAQFGDLRANLSAAMEQVSAEVEIAEKEEGHAERERANKERRSQAFRWDKTEHTHQKMESFIDEQSMQKVDKWLDPVNFEDNHDAAVKLQHQERVKDNPASTPTHDELRSNFGTFLEGVFKQVVLVVDAIDESSMRECMIGDLKTFKKQCPFIKILVSSREELDITKAFKSFPHVKINQSDVADDIESFVKAEVAARIQERELTIRRPEVQQIICERLVARSEGMFQWVKCQIQVLCSLGTDKAILKALDQMPTDLAGTYARILQRLEHDVENVERYQKLLRWLVRSTRSLTLDELAECIGIDLDEDNESMDFDAVETYPENLLKRCSSLVTISDDGRVSLAHFTVKEFLVSETTRTELKTFCVGSEEVEIELAQTCLTYLCYSDFIAGSITDEEALEETMSKYRFLDYATTA